MTQPSGDALPTWDPEQFQNAVQSTLDQFLEQQALRLAPLGSDGIRLLDQARVILTGGKRFRAAFCYWGFRSVSTEDATEGPLLRACAALEILHASALVHDDFMDASDTRRGRPATHRTFADEHLANQWRGAPHQYGAAAAILLGDLLLSWADELLRRCGLPEPQVSRAMELFDLCRSEVIAGQFLDVSAQARGRADVDTAMTVLRFKSAKYSVERPLQIGATLAGAEPDAIVTLGRFGLPLGEAFQLRDDLLGVFGDPLATGKPAGDDLVEGKRTVLVALALDAANPEDARTLDQSLGRPLDDVQIAHLREIINQSGAHAQVEEAIELLTQQAQEALSLAVITDASRSALAALAAAATKRVR